MANILWLSIVTYDDPKRTVIRRVYEYKANAYRRASLRYTSKRKDYWPISNEIWELNLSTSEMKFVELLETLASPRQALGNAQGNALGKP